MSYQQSQPLLGATFVPGGFDDYYLPAPAPELVSPAPQRIMPEVPEQIHNGIAQLELEANGARTSVPPSSGYSHNGTPSTYGHHGDQGQYSAAGQYGSSGADTFNHPPMQSSIPHGQGPTAAPQSQANQSDRYSQVSNLSDQPNFSPFPRVFPRPPHVPPSDEEREALLEDARLKVLNSNDPEAQLVWAQDALAYVDAAMLYEQRISETQAARPATPRVEHQIRIDAMNIVTFLADQRHPKAEFIKGMWLEFGKFGQRMDKREAFRCYTRAAEKGYARAEYRMGMQFEQANDPVKALIHYKRGAEAGDSAANYRLGMMTLLGQNGQPQDYNRGIQLLNQSAQTADENAPQGAYVLGMLLIRELPQISIPEMFLPYDEAGAREYVEKAAFLGFARAQLKMGSAYELCSLGCEFNPALSIHYNALAARQGESEAEMALSKWFLCGYEGVFQKNEELAYMYARRAAQAGLATAMFAMGYYNEIGVHVPANLDKALEWYEKAAKTGSQDAVARIEGMRSRALTKNDHENVAISRIRSQYGSKRGNRPDRFKSPSKPLPPINDTASESSGASTGYSPSVYSPNTPQAPAIQYMTSRPPNRNNTTTPYPLDDRPPTVPPPVERPLTVTPYPVDDRPPEAAMGPGSAGMFFRPDLRATSIASANVRRTSGAFTINPDILVGSGGPNNQPPGARLSMVSPPGPVPPRPYTTVNEVNGARERPPPAHRVASGGLPTSGYRQPGGPSVERPESKPTVKVDKPEPPRLDIGFSAPLDERRNRLQKAAPNSPKTQQPRTQDVGYAAPLQSKPLQYPQRSSSGPMKPQVNDRYSSSSSLPLKESYAPQARPYDRPSTGHQTGVGRPDSRPSSRPNSRPSSRPGSSAGRPLRPDAAPEPPPKTEVPVASKSVPGPAAAAPRPPGTGPKTFEDMGIPQQTKDNDCIVM